MKSSLRLALTLSLAALGTLSSHAQMAPKILTVDMAKLFDGNWKTKEQMTKLQADTAKAQEHATALKKEGEGLISQLQALEEKAKAPTETADMKTKDQADAQKLYTQIQQKKSELTTFGQQTEGELRQRSQAFRNAEVAEIAKVAVEIAKQHGATYLIDKAGPTMIGISNILYADPSLDITDEVQAAINKDHPADAAMPTSSAPAAAAPAASSPQITVPGISK